MTVFTRTPSGIVGSRFFYSEPIVWVEGPSDIYFYEPILGELNCRLKFFGGSKNAEKLIEELCRRDNSEYPFAVILDGDYGFLEKQRSPHRWVIKLRKYSIENYFWAHQSLNRSCLKHAQCGENQDAVGTLMRRADEQLEEVLFDLIAIDVAARKMDPAPEVLPDRIERLLDRQESPEICHVKVKQYLEKGKEKVDAVRILDATKLIKNYIDTGGKVSDVVNGHVLFGIIRRIFTHGSSNIRGKKCVVNDDALMQLLSDMLWRVIPSEEHRRLRNKLRSVVQDMNSHLAGV